MVNVLRITFSYLLVLAIFVLTSNSLTIAQVTFTGNKGQFLADNPGLAFQDFQVADVPPDSAFGCAVPINSNSDGICFSPGDILFGLEFTPDPGPPPNNPNIISLFD